MWQEYATLKMIIVKVNYHIRLMGKMWIQCLKKLFVRVHGILFILIIKGKFHNKDYELDYDNKFKDDMFQILPISALTLPETHGWHTKTETLLPTHNVYFQNNTNKHYEVAINVTELIVMEATLHCTQLIIQRNSHVIKIDQVQVAIEKLRYRSKLPSRSRLKHGSRFYTYEIYHQGWIFKRSRSTVIIFSTFP